MQTHLIYFSARNRTKKLVRTFGEAIDKDSQIWDLLRHPLTVEQSFSSTDLVVLGAPVYSGRVAPPAMDSIRFLRGDNTPAIILTTYGGRAYEDTLLELQDCLEEHGFVVIAAGAFIAKHAVFPRYSAERPDEQDALVLQSFARACMEKLQNCAPLRPGMLFVKGNRPYRKPVDMTIYPRARRTCVNCGTCAALCPCHVINPKKPRARPAKGCHSCGACIQSCPQKARYFGGPLYTFFDVLGIVLHAYYSRRYVFERVEPELFI
jgi:ferredoxin